jgi:hypothetical protein
LTVCFECEKLKSVLELVLLLLALLLGLALEFLRQLLPRPL